MSIYIYICMCIYIYLSLSLSPPLQLCSDLGLKANIVQSCLNIRATDSCYTKKP